MFLFIGGPMKNLFDNTNLTGNIDFCPKVLKKKMKDRKGVEKENEMSKIINELNEILVHLSWPTNDNFTSEDIIDKKLEEKIEIRSSLSKSLQYFLSFINTLYEWTQEKNLIPRTITKMRYAERFGYECYWLNAEGNLDEILQGRNWNCELIKELFFLLFQYLLYQDSLYADNREKGDNTAYKAWKIQEDEKKQLRSRSYHAKYSILPFFMNENTKGTFDNPLDIGLLSALYHTTKTDKAPRNYYYAIAKYMGTNQDQDKFTEFIDKICNADKMDNIRNVKGSFQSSPDNDLSKFINEAFKNFPLKRKRELGNDEKTDTLTAEDLAMNLNTLYTPLTLFQFSYFIRERLFHFKFTETLSYYWDINRFGNPANDMIVNELLCSPFLAFRNSLLSLYVRTLYSNPQYRPYRFDLRLWEKHPKDQVNICFKDFLDKLHFITLPAFLLKGQCLYEQLKQKDGFIPKQFFETAEVWMEDYLKNAHDLLSTASNDSVYSFVVMYSFFHSMVKKVKTNEFHKTIEQNNFFAALEEEKKKLPPSYIIMNHGFEWKD